MIFTRESEFLPKPSGKYIETYSNIPMADMFEIVTFVNNFPVSAAFSTLSDTLPVTLSTPLTMTGFMKINV